MSSALQQAKALSSFNNKNEVNNMKLQYQYNKSLAEYNNSFQEQMSNTAHQREIADLKKAGLNPVLSVTGGNGASSPSGSATSVSKPNTDMSLPSKVMDMAMAQLNSATALQTTAMQTANALTIAREQIANSWLQHTTPSGNSYFGQYQSAKDNIFNKINELFPNRLSLPDMISYIVRGKVPNTRNKNKTFNNSTSHFGWNSSSNSSSNPSKGSKQYYKAKAKDPYSGGYTDIDDIIAYLESPHDSLSDYYKAKAKISKRYVKRHKR